MPRSPRSPLAQAIERWREAHEYVHKPLTMRTYLGSLRRFLAFTGEDATCEAVHPEEVSRYIATVMDHRYMARNDFRALTVFSKWAAKAGYLPLDTLQTMEAPRVPKWRPKPLPDKVVPLLVEAASSTRMGARDRAIIMLSLCTGARPNEIRQLRWPEDVNLETRVIFIREETSKTASGHRKIGIDPQAAVALREYVDRYRPEGPGLLFLNARGKPLTYYGFMEIHHRLRDELRKQGIEGYQAYRNRHTAITNFVRAGANTWTVQRLAGHKSPVTTQAYIGDISDDAVAQTSDTFSRRYGRAI